MARLTALLAAAGTLAGIVSAASSDEPVLRLGEPVPFDWFTTCDEAHFWSLDDHGVAYGMSARCDLEPETVVVRTVGSDYEVVPHPPAIRISGIGRVSEGGTHITGTAWTRYEAGDCSDGVFSTGRDFILDLSDQTADFFTPLCPTFTPFDLSADGRVAAGSERPIPLGSGLPAALVWRDGEISSLETPIDPDRGSADGSSAGSVSDDGSRIAGLALWEGDDQTPPLLHATMWSEDGLEVVPHFNGAGVGPLGSRPYNLSGDGSTMLGMTGTYEFVLGSGGDPDSWVLRQVHMWVYRDGQFTLVDDGTGGVFLGGITSDGSLVYGQSDFFVPDRSGLIWTETTGLVTADEYLAGLAVDLGGQSVIAVRDTSADGAWMLVELGVSDDTFEYARISVPCSAADITGDQIVALDDLAAYINRFEDGHPLADLNGDALLDLADLVAFVGLFVAGCP